MLIDKRQEVGPENHSTQKVFFLKYKSYKENIRRDESNCDNH